MAGSIVARRTISQVRATIGMLQTSSISAAHAYQCGEHWYADRLEKHRRSTRRGGPGMEAAYLVIPSSLPGKSAARELEDKFIKAMQDAGFPLSSVADGRKRRAPRAVSQA